ncbi:MAG: helix-turn-helix domain-containing protein [Candidatus Kerfeldbacteria bacterium]
MSNFKQQPVRQHQTVGEQLRVARQSQGLVMTEIARAIKVPQRYLEALESGRYSDLPSPVYVTNYLKLYCRELGVRWEKIEEDYKREIRAFHPDVQRKQESKRHKPVGTGSTPHQRKPLLIPRLLRFGVAGIVVLLLVIYFSWEIVQLLSPPELVIEYPTEDVIVADRKITIRGKTEPEAIVEINGQGISVDPDGRFIEDVYLHEGLNSLRITTRSKRSSERVEIRNILYEAPEEDA